MTEKQQMVEFQPQETKRILKNVIFLGVAFMVHFTAYGGATTLQSSINAEAGLGTASLAAVYAGLIFSSIFLPTVVIKWLGAKWAMVLSLVTYMPYILAQMYPTFYTLVPAGLLVGLGGGPLWCANNTYISVVSDAYCRITKARSEDILPRFLGLFSMIFQLNLFGNLISSFLLSSGGNEAALTSLNASTIPELCGANFLPSTDAGEALQQQPHEKIVMLNGIYLGCMIGATIILSFGVDSMKRYDAVRTCNNTGMSGIELLTATLKLMVVPNHLMLIMMNFFNGYQLAFMEVDYTMSFVSCAVGPGAVGLVMMAFGLANAFGCVATGYLVKLTGRVPVICSAAMVLTAMLVAMLIWRPQEGQVAVLYGIAVVWGFCDSAWRVQVTAFGRSLFPGREEALFSNFILWQSVGHITAYISSPYLRTYEKIYFILAALIVGVFLYCIVEYKAKCGKRKVDLEKNIPAENGYDNKCFQNTETVERL